jgi:hypothetical protein
MIYVLQPHLKNRKNEKIIKHSIHFRPSLMVNCQEDNLGFGELDSPTALTVTAEIVGKSVAFLMEMAQESKI